MKKILGLTSLALLGVVALTGCSCSKNGTYEFAHVEYEEGDKTKTTDCKKTEDLPEEVQFVCAMAEEAPKYVIDGNKMYLEGEEDDSIFFKVEDEEILISEKEDGEYEESGMLYKDGKIYFGEDGLYIVFAK